MFYTLYEESILRWLNEWWLLKQMITACWDHIKKTSKVDAGWAFGCDCIEKHSNEQVSLPALIDHPVGDGNSQNQLTN